MYLKLWRYDQNINVSILQFSHFCISYKDSKMNILIFLIIQSQANAYSKISIISTLSIKRTPLNISWNIHLNVHYDLKHSEGTFKCTVSIKHTVWDYLTVNSCLNVCTTSILIKVLFKQIGRNGGQTKE